jgi:stage II sporulation protein AA (anti-sigma F factor antagonist)
MLEIKTTKAGSATIVNPAGRIDSTTAKVFEESVLGFLDANSNNVIVDMSKLEYISSAGLRVFLTAAKKAKSLGGALTTCSAQPSVREVFEISGFANMLGMYVGIDDACAALKG